MKDDDDNKKIKSNKRKGDFVTSYFAWLPLENQKKVADKLSKIADENEKENTIN